METRDRFSFEREQFPISPQILFSLGNDPGIQVGLDRRVAIGDFQRTKALQTNEAPIRRRLFSAVLALQAL